jgi:prevent-host-death family protein
MRDHIKRAPPRRQAARKSVGVRELKTHAARILRQVRESRASYVVTHRGRTIGVILPVDAEDDASPASESPDAITAWETFVRAGRRLERRFGPGVSGVRLLSGMRR